MGRVTLGRPRALTQEQALEAAQRLGQIGRAAVELGVSRKTMERAMRGYVQPSLASRRQNTRTSMEVAFRRKYALDWAGLGDLIRRQQFRCAACHDHLAANGPGAKWAVDHDHVTGEVRGVLCRHCNGALGFVRDSPERLRKLIRYIAQRRLRFAGDSKE